jgi:hypothetical protein
VTELLLPHQPDDPVSRVVLIGHLFRNRAGTWRQLGQVEAKEPGGGKPLRPLSVRSSFVVEAPPAGRTRIAVTGKLSEVGLMDRIAAAMGTAHFPNRPSQLAKLAIALRFIQ